MPRPVRHRNDTAATMSGRFEHRYTQQQRDALACAYVDLEIRPAARVVQLAKAGKLQLQGKTLDPFETNANTVRHEAGRLRRDRARRLASRLSDLPGREADKRLLARQRNLCDAELEAEEKKKTGKRSIEKLRQIAAWQRDIARIAIADEPAAPVQNSNGSRTTKGEAAPSELASSLLADHRRAEATNGADGEGPFTGATDEARDDGEHQDAALQANGAEQTRTDDEPGSPPSEHSIASLEQG